MKAALRGFSVGDSPQSAFQFAQNFVSVRDPTARSNQVAGALIGPQGNSRGTHESQDESQCDSSWRLFA